MSIETLPLRLINFFCFVKFLSVALLSSDLQLSGKEAPDIHCRDSVGNTPLHCAAYRGQKQCIIKLLKSGASPIIKNSNGISVDFRHCLLIVKQIGYYCMNYYNVYYCQTTMTRNKHFYQCCVCLSASYVLGNCMIICCLCCRPNRN